MKKIGQAFLLILVLFQSQNLVLAQNISNEGTDFWAVFPTHVPSGINLARMSIFITAKTTTDGNVFVGNNAIPFTVEANEIREIPISYEAAYIHDHEANRVVKNKAVHIVVNDNRPKIAVFSFISANARSEAHLVLPTDAMGKKYIAMGEGGSAAPVDSRLPLSTLEGRDYIILIATEDNTKIFVRKNNVSNEIVLPNKGDIYEMLVTQDIAGTVLESEECKKFAAYSGHSGVAYYGNTTLNGQPSFDPLLQQLYPIESWGRTYGLVPFKDRTYFYKIIAAEDNTQVFANGVPLVTLSAGEVFGSSNLPLSDAVILTANNVISVAQFAYSQDALSAVNEPQIGDPDMVILNAEEYNIKKITLFASFNRTPEFYVNIFMKTSGTSSFRVNGLKPNESWQNMPSNPEYSYTQIRVDKASLTLTADEGFNAIAYGFGRTESYAYSAGTNLAVDNFLKLTNLISGNTYDDGCVNQPLNFKVVLPRKVKKITWKFENSVNDDTDLNPVAEEVVNSYGVLQYQYNYKKAITFNSTGVYQLTVEVELVESTDPCAVSGVILYNYTFEIRSPDVSVPDTVALLSGGKVRIGASTTDSDLTYKWSPSDGLDDDSVLSPYVSISEDATYTLTAISDIGCMLTKTVYVQVLESFPVPNSFSPNGDGINDTWNLKLLNTYLDSTVEIFNRYGERVFFSKGYSVPFDGNYKNEPLPVGVYYYLINPKNGKNRITGPITIFR